MTGEFLFLRLHRIALLQVKEIKRLHALLGQNSSKCMFFAHGWSREAGIDLAPGSAQSGIGDKAEQDWE
jgi:hypothetical protein